MLSAGFTTTDYLKSRILPEAARARMDWNEALEKLGKAVAGRINRHCNRSFAYSENVEQTFHARSIVVVLSHQPVTDIESVQIRSMDGTLTPCEDGYQLNVQAGLIDFPMSPGSANDRTIVTYSGGYWLDPWDGTQVPTGLTPLPEDVLEAFIQQCQHTAEARGLFGAIALRPSKAKADANQQKSAELLEDVITALLPYRVYSGE